MIIIYIDAYRCVLIIIIYIDAKRCLLMITIYIGAYRLRINDYNLRWVSIDGYCLYDSFLDV